MVDALIEDIQTHLDTLDNALERYSGTSDSSIKQESLQRAQREISYIDPKITQLDNLVRRSPDAEDYQEDVTKIKEDFRDGRNRYSQYHDEFQLSQSQQQAYQEGNNKLGSANENLKKAINDADETNKVLKLIFVISRPLTHVTTKNFNELNHKHKHINKETKNFQVLMKN